MIGISCKTKAKEALKMGNYLKSYLFEQEYGELKNCSAKEIETLKKAIEILNKIVINNKIK